MTSDESGRRGGPLVGAPRTILLAWSAVALVYGALTIWSAQRSEGWGGLVLAVGVMIVVWALVAIGISALFVRFALASPGTRMVAAIVAPPAMFALILFVFLGLT